MKEKMIMLYIDDGIKMHSFFLFILFHFILFFHWNKGNTMLFLFTILACGDKETVPDIELYDKSCNEDVDCMTVYIGDVCGCDCSISAINVSEAEAWSGDIVTLREDCFEVLECGVCPNSEAYCESGACIAAEVDTETE